MSSHASNGSPCGEWVSGEDPYAVGAVAAYVKLKEIDIDERDVHFGMLRGSVNRLHPKDAESFVHLRTPNMNEIWNMLGKIRVISCDGDRYLPKDYKNAAYRLIMEKHRTSAVFVTARLLSGEIQLTIV